MVGHSTSGGAKAALDPRFFTKYQDEDEVSIAAAGRFVHDIEYWFKQQTRMIDKGITSEWITAKYCASRRKMCPATDVCQHPFSERAFDGMQDNVWLSAADNGAYACPEYWLGVSAAQRSL